MKFLTPLIVFFYVFVGFAAEQPNVILILADDMAPGDLSPANGGISSTPRLDALAKESAVFSSAYSASPVCAPARASLFTGRYSHRTGVVTLNQDRYPELTRIRLDETLISERFSANGYVTGLVGKWHSGYGQDYAPHRRGFDEAIFFRNHLTVPTYFDFSLMHGDQQVHYDDGRYLTDVLTAEAIDFVRRHSNKPFFLHLAHYAPHRPLSAPEDIVTHYREQGLNEDTSHVYAMIEVMDRGIGELLDELDTLGLAENTLIIFASDNGPDPVIAPRFNEPFRGTKYMVNEGGIRVPFFVRWTGTIEPGDIETPIHFTDVVPALIEICGLKYDLESLPLDGVSFADLLGCSDREHQPPRQRFWQWNRELPGITHNGAVREGDWKLVKPFVTRNFPKGASELPYRLYHLPSDPGEENNLADENPEMVKRLSQLYRSWFTEIEADRKRH